MISNEKIRGLMDGVIIIAEDVKMELGTNNESRIKSATHAFRLAMLDALKEMDEGMNHEKIL
jgi:hypothetical protein